MDFQSLDSITAISTFLKSYGLLAPIVASALFIVQAIFPVFPYVILAAAGGLLFGFKLGFLLAWSGALAGACLAYWICRLAGSEWVIKTIQSRFSYDIRDIDTRLAFWSIIIARVLPVVPTPIIMPPALAGSLFGPSSFPPPSASSPPPCFILVWGFACSRSRIFA